MSIHSRMTYYRAEQRFDYNVVIASPGSSPCSASIISHTAAAAEHMAQKPLHVVIAKEGGAETALRLAEQYLDRKHPGFEKHIGGPIAA